MPRYDRTGPLGARPRTGWGLGSCNTDASSPRFSWSGLLRDIGRRGLSWGGGKGRCRGGSGRLSRFGLASSQNPADEAETLKAEIAELKEALSAMEGRLTQLNKKD